MVKRYGLGAKAEKITDESVQFGLMGIVERENGDYVRYKDVESLLEAIGAGGVGGRITSKGIDEHRAEFEAWLSSVETMGATGFERHGEDGFYMDWDVQRPWIAWKAARGIKE